MTSSRWIRARVLAWNKRLEKYTYHDVGVEELKKISKKYKNVVIETANDWGRYAIPRNKEDKRDKEIMRKLLKREEKNPK